MKLRIIDDIHHQQVRIELSYIDLSQTPSAENMPPSIQREAFIIEDFSSPFSKAFIDTLTWYFQDYPARLNTDSAKEKKAQSRAQDVIAKYIKNGQHLGDALLGDNHTLNKFRELIEERGYHQCEVHIESSRIEFFELPWEALILPEANYLLATTAAGFKRVFSPQGKNENNNKTPAEIDFKLSVIGPTQQQLAQMMGGDNQEPLPEQQSALNIVRLCDRYPQQASAHLSHEAVFNELSFDSALNIDIAAIDSSDKLNATLQQSQAHIVCLTGHIELDDGDALWQYHQQNGSTHTLSCSELFAQLREHRIPLLLLNIDGYQQQGKPVSANTGLAYVSCLAQQSGIHNVIGFNQDLSGSYREQVITAFYQQLCKGLSVAQAAVETRKHLQSLASSDAANHDVTPLMLAERAIQSWPALSHYGNQRVVFFAAAPPPIDAQLGIENAQQTQQIRQHLFGFFDDLLPVHTNSGNSTGTTRFDNGEFVQLASLIQDQSTEKPNTGAALILGNAGSGKTLLTHHLAFYAAQKQHCVHAFRFDFATHDYSQHDMLTMMAPVLGIKDQDVELDELTAQALNKLAQIHCLLVLDNAKPSQAMFALIDAFRSAGQTLLVTSDDSHHEAWQSSTKPLSLMLCQLPRLRRSQSLGLLAAYHSAIKPSAATPDKPHDGFNLQAPVLDIAAHCDYHPWLVHKLGAMLATLASDLASDSAATQHNDQRHTLVTQWQSHVEPSSPKRSFYDWQWQQLPAGLQQLLLICSEFNDVLLEMLMVAWEREKAVSDIIAAALPQPVFDASTPHFNAAIQRWKQQGFVKIRPHGHVIDHDASEFLQPLRADSAIVQQTDLSAHISRLLCAGLRILSEHVLRQQNPAIFRNLLNNRALWAQQLQKLWSAEYFGEFIKTKSLIEQLMQQAQLGNEFANWASTLIQDITFQPLPHPNELSAKQAEHYIAWFSVANSAFNTSASQFHADQGSAKVFEQIAEQTQHWLAQWSQKSSQINVGEKPHPHLLAMTQHSNNFLSQYYGKNQQWQQVVQCNTQSLAIVEPAQAWPLVSQILMHLANAHVQLEQPEIAREYEDRIVFALPYAHAPAGYRSQKIVDVMMNRIQRQDINSLPPLITELEQCEDANRWQEFLSGVKADVAFSEQRWQDALPHFVNMWQQVHMQMQAQQQTTSSPQAMQQLSQQQKLLHERLLDIKKHLSDEVFEREFANISANIADNSATFPATLDEL